MIIIMINGILSSLSVPVNGCPLNGTVIGVRLDAFTCYVGKIFRYLNELWKTQTYQNIHKCTG